MEIFVNQKSEYRKVSSVCVHFYICYSSKTCSFFVKSYPLLFLFLYFISNNILKIKYVAT